MEEGRGLLRKQWASWSTPAVFAAGSIRLGRDLETGCVPLVSHPWTGHIAAEWQPGRGPGLWEWLRHRKGGSSGAFLRVLRVTRYLVHLCPDTSPCGGDRSLGNTDMTPCLWGSVWSAPHAEACAQGPFLPPCLALCPQRPAPAGYPSLHRDLLCRAWADPATAALPGEDRGCPTGRGFPRPADPWVAGATNPHTQPPAPDFVHRRLSTQFRVLNGQ